jgi:hypothetical protein
LKEARKVASRHVRENETITVDPIGVLGVEVHELVEENVGNGGHAHGGTGVARVGLGGGINLGAALVEFELGCIHRNAADSRSIGRESPFQLHPKDLAAVAGTDETRHTARTRMVLIANVSRSV